MERPNTETERTAAGSEGGGDADPGRMRVWRRRPALTGFDTRTQRWHEAGLAFQVDRNEARRALREAILLFVLTVAVLVMFALRRDLFPDAAREVRYVTAGLLILLGWGLARTAAKGLAPALLRRMDPATAGTVGFLIRLFTIVGVIFGSLAIAGVKLETLAVGGAFTAVILGLAAQQTLGNVIAGAMLLSTRPFRVADRVRLQGGFLAGEVEGTVASLGLFYTTLVSGSDRIMIPNSTLMQIAVIPLSEPDSVEFIARFESAEMTPAELQARLQEGISVPLRRPPRIELESLDADDVLTLQITVTPRSGADGSLLATEVLRAVRAGGGEAETDEKPAA